MAMAEFEVRTDLALEIRESFEGDGGEIRGVVLEETKGKSSDIKITRVVIKNEEGAAAMGKPMGTYITLEAPLMAKGDEDYHRDISEELADHVKEMIAEHVREKKGERLSVLVVGLGNQDVTPDALGPMVVDNLLITRHLKQPKAAVSGIVPGVMAQTGMETAEIIYGIVEQTQPDAVIVIDALAARSISRLGTTIQLTDTGIQPGSGVGNHRSKLAEDSLGVPVIAIGVPTVVGAATIVFDTVDALIQALSSAKSTEFAAEMIEEMNMEEKHQLIRELLEPRFGPMFVTPKDIDASVKRLSFTISEGINIAMFA